MKKLLVFLFSTIVAFSLIACGGKDNDNKPSGNMETPNQVEENASLDNQQEELPTASTKTLAYFQMFLSGGEYTVEMTTTSQGVTINTKSAYKDDMVYSESSFDDTTSCILMKDGYQYIIDHNTKTCMKISAIETTVQNIFADESKNYEIPSSTGLTELNGKTYEYEEFSVAGETVEYLFDGNDLKFIKASVMEEESLVEIISIKKGADTSLFEVPEGYQTIT